MSATQTPSSGPSPHRLFGVATLAAVVGLIVTLSFGYADHSPRPHGVRLAVVAPAVVVRNLAAGLDHVQPGGFDLVSVASSQSGTGLVRSQSVAGAFEVPASGAVTIVTAGAAGVSQQSAIDAALSGAAGALHRQVRTLDVVPLPSGDRAGLGSFVFELGLLIPSVIGSVGLFLLGARFRIWWRASAALLFAVLAGLMSVFALDLILGSLTGSSVALIGVGVFGALSFVLTVSALQALFGLKGTGLAVLLLLFIGNAVSGGTVSLGFLPDGFRQLANWLPNAAIVHSARDVIYFSGQDLGHSMLVLSIWVVVALALLLGVDLLHTLEKRRTPERSSEIHATPGAVLLRRRAAASEPH